MKSMSDRKKKPKKMKRTERKEAEGGDKEVLKTRVQDLELSAERLTRWKQPALGHWAFYLKEGIGFDGN